MYARIAAVVMAGLLAASCSSESAKDKTFTTSAEDAASERWHGIASGTRIAASRNASAFLQYDRITKPVRRGSTVWHPVRLSESRALDAISQGSLELPMPDGRTVQIPYARHIEHPDGNWTWIGKSDEQGRQRTVLTFGEKAVFGSIASGGRVPIQLTTVEGRTWLVESDPLVASEPTSEPDVLSAGSALVNGGDRPIPMGAPKIAAALEVTPAATTTVDVLLGYTTAFAQRFGGQSQAVTRLNYLVDLTNEAYAASQIDWRIRMVRAMQVEYPDTTSNQTALFELTGVSCTATNSGSRRTPDRGFNCTPASRPAGLQPLAAAREQYGADLVALVRTFQSPENGSCGTGWLLGAGQGQITSESADFAFSVVSDSNGDQAPDDGLTCREEYLAHELGHNMGLQHDVESAQGTDDTNGDSNPLDPEEFGALPYAFGYRAEAEAGNFYTIMAVRRAGQTGFRVFSNPRITTCGGFPCGNADRGDNARALAQTMPIVSTFRATTVALSKPKADVDGDGRSDLLWYRPTDGTLAYWVMAGSAVTRHGAVPVGGDWRVLANADFNGDGRLDLIWNRPAGDMQFWAGDGNAFAQRQFLAQYPVGWNLVGAGGDIDGDGRNDMIWHRASDGALAYWVMNGAQIVRHGAIPVGGDWRVIAVGDFNGDARADLVWNRPAGDMQIWMGDGAAFAQREAFTNYPMGWELVGAADVNGDARSDLVWYRPTDGAVAYWIMSGSTIARHGLLPAGAGWRVEAMRDVNGDGFVDLIWNRALGDMQLWLGDGDQFAQRGFFANYPAGWQLVPTDG